MSGAVAGAGNGAAGDAALRRAVRWLLLAHLPLLAASLRHHFAWGAAGPWPEALPVVLGVFETLCLAAYVALAGVAWIRGARAAGEPAGAPPARSLLRRSWPVLLAAVAVPPFLSADVVNYVQRGRILALHGENPYVVLATGINDDPVMAFGDEAWLAFPLPYGPVVAELQGAVAWASSWPGILPPLQQLWLGILLFKGLALAAHVLGALAAAGIARELRPRAAGGVFLLFLWNPFFLLEGPGNAHNDVLAILPLLLGVLAALRARHAAAAFFTGLSLLTKPIGAAAAALLLVAAARRRRLPAFLAGSALAGAALLFWYLRFFRAEGAFDFLRLQSELAYSGPLWAASVGLGLLSAPAALAAGRAVVLAAVLLLGLRLWRARAGARPLVAAVGLALLLTVLLATTAFSPWYHLWWMPFGLLLGHGFLYRAAFLATFSSPLSYMVWTTLRRLDDPHQWTQFALCVALPLVAAAAWRGGGQGTEEQGSPP